MKHKTARGFTLVEVLVSLILFSVGLLGVAFQFSSGIKTRVNSEVHSSVMQIAMQAIEPLNNSILISNTTFKAALTNGNVFGSSDSDSAAVFSTNNSNVDNFSVSIYSASDSAVPAINLIEDNNLNTWLPPYTVVLMITYTGKDGSKLNFPTTHIFVP